MRDRKTTSAIPLSSCPHCRGDLSAATDPIGQARPSPGDYSVCANCGGLLRFAADLTHEGIALADVPAGELDAQQLAVLADLQARFRGRP